MTTTELTERTIVLLAVILALLTSFSILFPQASSLPLASLDYPMEKGTFAVFAALLVAILYGALGLIGTRFSPLAGIVDVWNTEINSKKRFYQPLIAGSIVGVAFSLLDIVFSRYNGVGPLPHPPFPFSIVASLAAAIGEEIIFRLFFISFGFRVLIKSRMGEKPEQLYLILTALSAIAFGFGHLGSVMVLFAGKVSPMLVIEILTLNGLLGLTCAYQLKRAGYLAAVGVHFWADIVWHVAWGLLIT